MSHRIRISTAVVAAALGIAAVPPRAQAAVVGSMPAPGELVVASDGADALDLGCALGVVLVHGLPLTVGAGSVDCASLTSLEVDGGPGANAIDLRAVTAAAFPGLDPTIDLPARIFVDAGAGDDTILGSPLRESIAPGDGVNDVTGGSDADEYSFSTGSASATTTIQHDPGGYDILSLRGTSAGESVAITPTQATLGGETVFYDGSTLESILVDAAGGDDTITVTGSDVPDVSLDGGDGADDFVLHLDSLADSVAVEDTGDTGSDAVSLVDVDCTRSPGFTWRQIGTPTGRFLNNGGVDEELDVCGTLYTGSSASAFTTWPTCSATVTTGCVRSFTVDGGAPPSGVEVEVSTAAGMPQIQVRRNSGYELLGSGSPVTLATVFRVELELGTFAPSFLITHGEVASYALHGSIATVELRPGPSAFLGRDCDLTSCGDDTTRADADYGGMATAALVEARGPADAAVGAYVATSAQTWSTPVFDAAAGAITFQLASPHLSRAGAVNVGSFTAFLPDALLTSLLGIADPTLVTDAVLAVTRAAGSSTTALLPTVTRVSGGVLVAASGFSYSTPKIGIGKAAVDTVAPKLTLPASPRVAEATGASGAAVSFSAVAADAVDAHPAVSCSPASGSTFALGSTTVDCTARDASGNTTSGSFTVSVADTTAPVLTLPADTAASGSGGARVDFAAAATDLVDGTVAVTCVPATGSLFPLGQTSVACSAADAHGNASRGTFTVTVTAPPAPPAASGGGGGGGGGTTTTAPAASFGNAGPDRPGSTRVAAGERVVTVAWPAGAVGRDASVSVTTADAGAALPGFRLSGTVVQVSVAAADGTRLTSFAQPLELLFPEAPAGAVPGYSTDGVGWTTIPALGGAALPEGQRDGYYRDETGAIHVLTRHLTLFALFERAPAEASAVRLLSRPRVSVAGRLAPGTRLVASPGRWSAPVRVVGYQWLRTAAGGALRPIARATSSRYRVGSLDVGARLAVRVTVVAGGRRLTGLSAPTPRVGR